VLTGESVLNLPEPNPRDLRVSIIGAGLMGHALGTVFAAAGGAVTICELDKATLASAPERIRNSLQAVGHDDPQDYSRIADSIRLVGSLNDLDPECSFVTEAISENLSRKQELFRELEWRLPKALFATNTSVLCIGEVSERMISPQRLLGTHWWNPPYLIPLVEVIQSKATRPEYVAWTLTLLKELGKAPVHVKKDTPGFIGNRLQHALWREAFALIEEGVCDAETVDLVVRNTLGMKLGVFGPIENADYVGLDLTLAIHEHVFPALSVATRPQAILRDLVAAGKLGAKSGQGLLPWPPGAREEVSERINKHLFSQTKRQSK